MITQSLPATETTVQKTYRNILAIDPGGTTGLAWRVVAPDFSDAYGSKSATDKYTVWDEIMRGAYDLVVCESFSSSGPVSRYGFKTIEIIGGIEALCFEKDIPLVKTFPARRMPYLADAIIRVIGFGGNRTKRKAEHEITAFAHLLWWEAHSRAS